MQDDQAPANRLIPAELLSNIRQSDCVLFLGADLPDEVRYRIGINL